MTEHVGMKAWPKLKRNALRHRRRPAYERVARRAILAGEAKNRDETQHSHRDPCLGSGFWATQGECHVEASRARNCRRLSGHYRRSAASHALTMQECSAKYKAAQAAGNN